ncbi:MAG: response regulator [Mariprofundaceae bacterium]
MSDFDLSNFIASFFDEAKERLASINQSLVAFESGSLNEEGLISLRRDAHTIKGSALMLGINDVGEVSHLFEDAMEYLIKHPEYRTPQMVQFLYDIHDHLQRRMEDQHGKELLESEPLRNQYKQLLSDIAAGGEQPAATTIEEHATQAAEASKDEGIIQIEPEEIEIEGFGTELIGADEAMAWQAEKQQPAEAQSPVAETASIAPTAEDIEEGPHRDAIAMQAVALTEDLDDFRPDVAQLEMKSGGQRQSSGRFLRVDAARLSGLSNQVVELSTEKSRSKSLEAVFGKLHRELRSINRNWQQFQSGLSRLNQEERSSMSKRISTAFEQQLRNAQSFAEELHYDRNKGGLMLDDLRNQVLGLMLRPLDSIFSTFPRAVRDTAVRCDKRVQLLISGKSVEMDQAVAESLVEPLVHLLNNAVAHGIETPEERRQAGKPEEGQITILARQSGNEVRIEVIDDGCGIDTDHIKKVAVERGVTTQLEVDEMDSAEIMEMIFRPGFSTHKNVDDVAGRGIGMNVVQDTVRRLTGAIRVHTKIGEGTRFILSLPVSIAVQHALLFRVGSQRLGMLTHMIEQALPLWTQTIEKGPGDKDFIRYGRHLVPIVDLRRMLADTPDALSKQPYVIIAEHIEGFVGIVIDELMEESEIVIRDLDPYMKRYQAQGLMGNTIIGDGSVLMLIEPYGIKEMGRTAPDIDLLDEAKGEGELLGFRVLLAEDSLIAREVEKSMLESIGFQVDTAIDGLDAVEKMQLHDYDILVTDLEMPRLDGFGLVRQLRNEARFEDLPILIISTRESAEDRMRSLESGADAYLVKQQLNGEQLRETVRNLVGSLTPTTDSSKNRPSNEAPIV